MCVRWHQQAVEHPYQHFVEINSLNINEARLGFHSRKRCVLYDFFIYYYLILIVRRRNETSRRCAAFGTVTAQQSRGEYRYRTLGYRRKQPRTFGTQPRCALPFHIASQVRKKVNYASGKHGGSKVFFEILTFFILLSQIETSRVEQQTRIFSARR